MESTPSRRRSRIALVVALCLLAALAGLTMLADWMARRPAGLAREL